MALRPLAAQSSSCPLKRSVRSASSSARAHPRRGVRERWRDGGKENGTRRGFELKSYRSGRSDEWASFYDEDGNDRGSSSQPGNDIKDDAAEFTNRSISLVQRAITWGNNCIRSLSRTIIREFSLDFPEDVVAFFLRGLGGILCLSFLKLMLGVIIPTLCLILFGFVAYRVYKSMYRTEGRGDTDEDESFFPENDNGNGKSEDVIDVRFYR